MSIVIETCPRCGAAIHDEVLATFPPIPCKVCWRCGWRHELPRETIEYRPFGGNAAELEKDKCNGGAM